MKKMYFAVAFFLLLGTNAQAQSDLPTSVADVHAHWSEAFNEKNLDRLCALYSDDAVVQRPDGTTAIGKSELCADLQNLMGIGKRIDMNTEFVVEGEEVSILRSRYMFTLAGEGNTEVKAFGSGIEVVEKQPDGTWLIIADHPQGGN